MVTKLEKLTLNVKIVLWSLDNVVQNLQEESSSTIEIDESDEDELKCNKCDYATLEESCLNEHLKTHTDIECEVCNSIFTNKEELSAHEQSQHTRADAKKSE